MSGNFAAELSKVGQREAFGYDLPYGPGKEYKDYDEWSREVEPIIPAGD